MDTSGKHYVVVVVSETDRLHEMARSSIEKLDKQVRSVRAVNTEAKRFAEEVASNPSVLHVKTYGVVGFCHPQKDRPNLFEPLVLEKGKPTPVSFTNMDATEWWVTTAADLSKNRGKIVASCARKLAEEMIIGDAIFFAVELADRDEVVKSMSCDARNRTVDIYPDPDGKIAKRLPKWIKIEDGPAPGLA